MGWDCCGLVDTELWEHRRHSGCGYPATSTAMQLGWVTARLVCRYLREYSKRPRSYSVPTVAIAGRDTSVLYS